MVFNIGSGSVSGGIVKFTEEPGENVVFYDKEPIPFQAEISVPKHLELMKASLTTLAGKIRANGQQKIDRIFYIFSSPWSVSQTKTIRIKEPKAFKVTESYMNRVIAEQEKQFQTDISKVGKIIEKKIVQVKINGYVVTNFYNKSTKDLEISVFFSVVPDDILLTVEEAVAKTFTVKNIWCHSFSLSVLTVIGNLFPQKEDFIHVDVTEEVTDIAIIKNNIMISAGSIPLGRNDFIRALSKNLNITEEIADSMIKMQCAKNNDELAAMKLSVAMDVAARDWLAKLFEVLDSFKEKIYVPDSLFLVANTDITVFLQERLQKHDFRVTLLDNKKIKQGVANGDLAFRLELMFLDNLYKI